MIKEIMDYYCFLYIWTFEPPAPSNLQHYVFTTNLKDAFRQWKLVLQARAGYTSQHPMQDDPEKAKLALLQQYKPFLEHLEQNQFWRTLKYL